MVTRGRLIRLGIGMAAVAGLLIPATADAGPSASSAPAGAVTVQRLDDSALESLAAKASSRAGTGEPSPAPTPAGAVEGTPGSPTPEAVIGTDERTQVTPTMNYPDRAVVHILVDPAPMGASGDPAFLCTGWLIARDAVATAAHCVYYDPIGAFYTITPGKDGASNPFGTCAPDADPNGIFASDSWVNSGGNGPRKDDYAAINLNCDLKPLGRFGFKQVSDSKIKGLKVTIPGYPADKAAGTQWEDSGKIKNADSKQVYYKIDTAPGESGGPVYKEFGNCGTCAVAIHTASIGMPPTKNTGTRIREKVGQFLNAVAALP